MPRLNAHPNARLIFGLAVLAILTVLGTVPTAQIAASARWGVEAARGVIAGQTAMAGTCTPGQITPARRAPDAGLHIVIARLTGDPDGGLTGAYADSLRAVLARAPGLALSVALLPCPLPPATAAAGLASQTGADLLITGSLGPAALNPGNTSATLYLSRARAPAVTEPLMLTTGPAATPGPSLAALILWLLDLPADPALLAAILRPEPAAMPALSPAVRSTEREAQGLALAASARQNTLPEQMEAARRAFVLAIAEAPPATAARLQRHLGDTLAWLGTQGPDPALLARAAAAYHLALTPARHAQSPLDWAAIQTDLAGVLRLLGEQTGKPEPLEQAAATFRAALAEQTRETVPPVWAETQYGLGLAMQSLGNTQNNAPALAAAATAFRAALEVQAQDGEPQAWLDTQTALADTLSTWGARGGDTDLLLQAVAAYRVAASRLSPDTAPQRWSRVQLALAGALMVISAQSRNDATTEEAATALRAALLAGMRDRDPLLWAEINYRLATVLHRLGEQRGSPGWLTDSAAAYRSALLEYSRRSAPMRWAEAKAGLGRVLQILGQMMASTDLLEQSQVAFDDALNGPQMAGDPMMWGRTALNSARTAIALHAVGQNNAALIAAWEQALAARQTFARLSAPHYVHAADALLQTIAARLDR